MIPGELNDRDGFTETVMLAVEPPKFFNAIQKWGLLHNSDKTICPSPSAASQMKLMHCTILIPMLSLPQKQAVSVKS